jgi:uncharacterized membrane protein SpoIIM required for sporulation
MNVQRWLKLRRPSWERLEQLVQLIERRGGSTLSRHELLELGRLYRCASADLSRARTLKLGPDVQVYLNSLVVKAHNQVYQRQKDHWSELLNFLWFRFPALVRQHIIYISLATTIFVIPMAIGYAYVLKDIHFAQLEYVKGQPLLSEDIWHTIEQHKMWTDQTEQLSPLASTLIATNNIRVAVLAFVLGITYGFGTAAVLCQNGVVVGTIFGVCRHYGMDDRLLAFVAPHGILELSSIFICGGAGLLIGKALLFPGEWRRIDSLRSVMKDALGLFAGCIPLLLVAGLIEGFISPRTDLDANAKFAVSIATSLVLILYLFVPRAQGGSPTSAESPLK